MTMIFPLFAFSNSSVVVMSDMALNWKVGLANFSFVEKPFVNDTMPIKNRRELII